MPLGSRWPLLIFWSHCQRSRSNCWSSSLVLSTQYLMILTTLVDFREKINPGLLLIAFWVARSNYSSSLQHCPLNILGNIWLILAKLCTVVATREWIIHCVYATLLNFVPGRHLPVCFSNVSCFIIFFLWNYWWQHLNLYIPVHP